MSTRVWCSRILLSRGHTMRSETRVLDETRLRYRPLDISSAPGSGYVMTAWHLARSTMPIRSWHTLGQAPFQEIEC